MCNIFKYNEHIHTINTHKDTHIYIYTSKQPSKQAAKQTKKVKKKLKINYVQFFFIKNMIKKCIQENEGSRNMCTS